MGTYSITKCDQCKTERPNLSGVWFILRESDHRQDAYGYIQPLNVFGNQENELTFCRIECLRDWALAKMEQGKKA